ncbi:MAG: HAD-IA family hydrolase [Chloroflexi bacterium]|nr:HAD-IA family hydrolase [Chloroflexota bacterium]
MDGDSGIRAIIFDMYGTLVHEPAFEECFAELAAAIGVPLDDYIHARARTVRDAMVGRLPSAEERARAILTELGRDASDDLAKRLAEMERTARWQRVRLYPATLPTLQDLRQRGYVLGLVSDCTSLMGRPIPEQLGIASLFDAMALSYEVGYAKPHPRIYQTVLEAVDVPPERCLYVGDGDSDELNGARALGMTTVRIDQEGSFARVGTPAPSDFVIVGLDELLLLPPLAPTRPGFPPLDLSWITPDLAIGGRVDPVNVPRLARLGIGGVVDLRAEESDDPSLLADHGIRFLHLPMPDCHPLTREQMHEGSRWVRAERAAGRKVLIHCQHGVGRSVMLAAAVLIDEGVPANEALARIRARRPRTAPNDAQVAAIYAYAEAIRERA